MQNIYIVQQGNSNYDDNNYYLESAEYGKIVGTFLDEQQAKNLQTKLIEFTYNQFKDRVHCIDLEDYFSDYKYPREVDEYEKLHVLLTQALPDHVQIITIEVEDKDYIHPENKGSLKKYCYWSTLDADIANQNYEYINMTYDNPEYEGILEDVMNIAENRFDAGIGLSWDGIYSAWDEYIERNKQTEN